MYGLVFSGVSRYPGVLSCVLVVRFMEGRKVCCVVCLACDVCVALSLSVTCGRVVWTCERVILWHTIMEEDR